MSKLKNKKCAGHVERMEQRALHTEFFCGQD